MTHPNLMHLLTMQRRLRQQALPLIDLFIHVVHVSSHCDLIPLFSASNNNYPSTKSRNYRLTRLLPIIISLPFRSHSIIRLVSLLA